MAKHPPTKHGSSKIRFIMLEADLAEGDINSVVTAIQNALRPNSTTQHVRLAAPSVSNLAVENEINNHAVESSIDGDEMSVEDEVSPPAIKQTRPRKLPTPKIIEFDLQGGISFEAYAKMHPSKNDAERFLVVLAWFKEHRPDIQVTVNHVYTCYRALKWPSGIQDFGSPIRKLKQQQEVERTGRGTYQINHMGIRRVEELGKS